MKKTKKKFEEINFDDSWSFSNIKYEPYSHNYHRYPAKFISPLVNRLIESESKENDVVCDIFAGCGTTLLEAKLLGRESIGYDINPVAKLITEVKTKALEPQKIEKHKEILFSRIEDVQINNDYHNTHERIQYWFTEESYLRLSRIYEAILIEKNQDIKKFFLCAFSHCLKNSSRWLMKSIKPTIDKQKKEIDVLKSFRRHLNGMIRKNHLLYEKLKSEKKLSLESKIYLQDITKLEQKKEVDLIITSPPYVTSYEYGDLHQLTLLWFSQKEYQDFCTEYIIDFKEFKRRFIGSSLVDKSGKNLEAKSEYSLMGSSLAVDIVSQLRNKELSLANKVRTYFIRMRKSFEIMHDLLKEGKTACVVIGNTKLRDVPILNAEVVYEQLMGIGFKEKEIIKRNSSANKMIAPYRNKETGKFTSIKSDEKTIAYQSEYILKVLK